MKVFVNIIIVLINFKAFESSRFIKGQKPFLKSLKVRRIGLNKKFSYIL